MVNKWKHYYYFHLSTICHPDSNNYVQQRTLLLFPFLHWILYTFRQEILHGNSKCLYCGKSSRVWCFCRLRWALLRHKYAGKGLEKIELHGDGGRHKGRLCSWSGSLRFFLAIWHKNTPRSVAECIPNGVVVKTFHTFPSLRLWSSGISSLVPSVDLHARDKHPCKTQSM